MKVAILYSGGKDSTYAISKAKEQNWDIAYLLSIKPNRKDCFCFHFATVENTDKQAEMLGIPHHLLSCTVADPVKEAAIVKDFVEQNPVDMVLLGGTGLQETQIRSIQNALQPLGIDVGPAHGGEDHEEVLVEMLEKGYEFMISQVASDGLMQWLGKIVTKENLPELQADSQKYGFHIGLEGGYGDTYCIDGPIFPKRIEILKMSKVEEDAYCGHVVIEELRLVDKAQVILN